MAHQPLKRGDRVMWGEFPGQVATTGDRRRGEVYVHFPNIANATGGHWLRPDELELDELTTGEISELIELLCTVDGQARGTTPPHPESVHGRLHSKLLRIRARLQ